MIMKALLVTGIVVLIGGVIWYLFVGEKMDNSSEKQQGMESTMGTVSGEPLPSAVKESPIASLREAMNFEHPLLCTYSLGTEVGGISSRMYVAGKKFRAEAETNGIKSQVLFDGNTQYVWTTGSMQGMKMNQSCLENMGSMLTEKNPAGAVSPQDYQETLDQAKNVKCEPIETDMSLIFSVPKEVEFTDQCAMMEQSKKMMDQVKGMVPAAYPGQ